MRPIDLSGKTALITGGTRNIGRAIAQSLAEAGADIALFYRHNDEAAAQAREEIRASTGWMPPFSSRGPCCAGRGPSLRAAA